MNAHAPLVSHTTLRWQSEVRDGSSTHRQFAWAGRAAPALGPARHAAPQQQAAALCAVDDIVFAEDGTIGIVTAVDSSSITIFHEGDLDNQDDDWVSVSYDLEAGHVYKSSDVDGGSIYSDCVQICDSGKLNSDMWGEQWWNDAEVTTSYVNFKVTRYEMSDGWGVEFYSTEGDTLRVFKSGDVHFKPAEAERTIYINELVEYDYEDDDRRRLAAVREQLATVNLALPIKATKLSEMRAASHITPKGMGAKDEATLEQELGDSRRRLAKKKRGMKTTGSFTLSKGR